MRAGGAATADDRRLAFTIAVIVLSAKMAKADGHVTPDEIAAFKRVFHIPPDEMKDVGRLFDEARPGRQRVRALRRANRSAIRQ